MCPDKKRHAENTAVLSRGLTQYGRISARQNRVCPCRSMVREGEYTMDGMTLFFVLAGALSVSVQLMHFIDQLEGRR